MAVTNLIFALFVTFCVTMIVKEVIRAVLLAEGVIKDETDGVSGPRTKTGA